MYTKGDTRMYGRTPLMDLETRQKQAKALEMRLMGYTFDEIAAECGYADRSGAQKAYAAAMRATISKASADRLRAQHEARAALYRRSLAPNLAAHEARAVEVLIKSDEHLARLHGLYQDPTPPAQLSIEIYEYPQDFTKAIEGGLADTFHIAEAGQ